MGADASVSFVLFFSPIAEQYLLSVICCQKITAKCSKSLMIFYTVFREKKKEDDGKREEERKLQDMYAARITGRWYPLPHCKWSGCGLKVFLYILFL